MSFASLALWALLPLMAAPSGAAPEARKFEAEVVCIGCELSSSDQALAQCNLHAQHEHGLKVESGQIWSILDNEKGHSLRTDHDFLTKRVLVRARPLYRAQYMEIIEFEVLEIEHP